MNEEKFDFRQCWTCEHCIFDLSERLHRCLKTGEWIRHGVHAPTGCRNYKR